MAATKRCMSCMQPVPAEATACPACGYDGTQQNPEGALSIGSRLEKGRFVVGKLQEVNARSAQYIGYDVKGMQVCTILEYLPAGAAARVKGEPTLQAATGSTNRFREGLKDFIGMYQRLESPTEASALPKKIAMFSQNGTAYVIFRQFEGMTLRELMRKSGGRLSYSQIHSVMEPVMDALQELHRSGLFHGNVSPDTILINRNGDVQLSGFEDEFKKKTHTNGYQSPEEDQGKELSSASDVYSVAAIFYRALVGRVPQDAGQRKGMDTLVAPSEVDPSISGVVSDAIWHAMLMDPMNRTATVADFRSSLNGEELQKNDPIDFVPNIVFPEDMEREEEPDPEKKRLQLWRMLTLISASFLAVMVLVYFISGIIKQDAISRKEQQEQENPEVIETTIPAPNYLNQPLSSITFDTVQYDYVILSSYDASKSMDVVIGQDPQPGTGMTSQDRLITLYVNRDKARTAVLPNFIGLYYMNAELLAKNLGIEVEIVYEVTDKEQQGLVIRQGADEGTEFLTTNVLKLTVAQAPEKPAGEEQQEQQQQQEQANTEGAG